MLLSIPFEQKKEQMVSQDLIRDNIVGDTAFGDGLGDNIFTLIIKKEI